MKVPVSPKQLSNCDNNINSLTIFQPGSSPGFTFEPTSVLDLRRSPSPVARKPADPLEWDEHVLQLDWDTIMRELDFHEESVPALKSFPQLGPGEPQIHHQNLPDFIASAQVDPAHFNIHPEINDIYLNSIPPQNPGSLELTSHSFHHIGNWNVAGVDFIQELVRAADFFDSNELQLCHVILERLNLRLQSPIGKPLQRAAFFFKEALLSILPGSNRVNSTRLSSWSEIVQTIKTYKAFSGISPIPMFNHFTTNQALLESLDGSPAPFIHVIDFDIGFGCHYASFMREFVEKADSCKLSSPVLRITAVVTEENAVETKLIKESLAQFAQELKIRFQIDFVLFHTFERLSFKAIKFMEGEKTAVLLSPTMFRRLGSTTNASAFANDLRRISPSIVVFVDSEGWVEPGAASFRRNFVNGLEFYSTMFESLDAAAGSGGGDWVRKIEMLLLKPRISAALEGCGRRVTATWRDVLCGAGMRAVQLSQFTDFQAECLLGKVQMKGFYVAKRQAELVLCWHDRPLVAISAWKC